MLTEARSSLCVVAERKGSADWGYMWASVGQGEAGMGAYWARERWGRVIHWADWPGVEDGTGLDHPRPDPNYCAWPGWPHQDCSDLC